MFFKCLYDERYLGLFTNNVIFKGGFLDYPSFFIHIFLNAHSTSPLNNKKNIYCLFNLKHTDDMWDYLDVGLYGGFVGYTLKQTICNFYIRKKY